MTQLFSGIKNCGRANLKNDPKPSRWRLGLSAAEYKSVTRYVREIWIPDFSKITNADFFQLAIEEVQVEYVIVGAISFPSDLQSLRSRMQTGNSTVSQDLRDKEIAKIPLLSSLSSVIKLSEIQNTVYQQIPSPLR